MDQATEATAATGAAAEPDMTTAGNWHAEGISAFEACRRTLTSIEATVAKATKDMGETERKVLELLSCGATLQKMALDMNPDDLLDKITGRQAANDWPSKRGE
jgi:hypothetical protein